MLEDNNIKYEYVNTDFSKWPQTKKSLVSLDIIFTSGNSEDISITEAPAFSLTDNCPD